ncbi:MAG: hypothetical protein GY832_08485 [Chloroflexi bacterium]|nr:hypothetical protein [Chloroflexota bacterium]
MKRQKIFMSLLALGLLLLMTFQPSGHIAHAANYAVVNTNDSGGGSLRQAIINANNNPGPDTITFSILPIPGNNCTFSLCSILPLTPLPTLTGDGTTINGYSQPGAQPATDTTPAAIMIQIFGDTAGTGANGFTIDSASNEIKGLVIYNFSSSFSSSGIRIQGGDATNNIISGNYVRSNSNGVIIRDGAQNNTVGGDTPAERNVISDNDGDGVHIWDSDTTNNTISGNYIGTNINGTADLGNYGDGVYIRDGAQNNTVGGDTAGERNVISGNYETGVLIKGLSTTGNTVSGNYIGLAANGTADLGNSECGVFITKAQNNTVGGDTAGERNVISGNYETGVIISGSGNTVSGNYIGTNWSGTATLGNRWNGVHIFSDAQNNTIGGNTPDERNIISGNAHYGVFISNSPMNNTVSGNYIGLAANGTADMGNDDGGVVIGFGAHNNTIGGDTAGERNVISGNNLSGVYIYGSGTMNNTVSGNYIGVNSSGTASLENDGAGVLISDGAQNNIVGGNTAGEGNVISGNDEHGIVIEGSDTANNTVSGNHIGTNWSGTAKLGNTWSGVSISDGAQHNVIGGDAPDERNVISGNGVDGVAIAGSGVDYNTISGNVIGADVNGTGDLGNSRHGVYIDARHNIVGPDNVIAYSGRDGVEVEDGKTGNTITQNSIFANQMGIDLRDGANGNIPAPAIVDTSLGSVNISGTACPNCTVEVFENSDADGEGETYVGSAAAGTGGDFTVVVGYLNQPYLTTTATDDRGTSEFSAVFTATVMGAAPTDPLYLPIVIKGTL